MRYFHCLLYNGVIFFKALPCIHGSKTETWICLFFRLWYLKITKQCLRGEEKTFQTITSSRFRLSATSESEMGWGANEVWDRETMFSQLALRSPCVVVSGRLQCIFQKVRYFRGKKRTSRGNKGLGNNCQEGGWKTRVIWQKLRQYPPPKQKKLVLTPLCYVKNNVAPPTPLPPPRFRQSIC